MFLIFDTETTGLPRNFNAPFTDTDNWPRMVQLAWQLHDETGKLIEVKNFIVKPEGYSIPFNAEKIHGISTQRAEQQGMPLEYVLEEFNKALEKAEYNVGHNIGFDLNIVGAEYHRKSMPNKLFDKGVLDTKSEEVAAFCQLPGGRGGKFKWPTLTELHKILFKEGFDEAHNASADVEATARCFLELVRIGIIGQGNQLKKSPEFFENFRRANPQPFELIGLNIQPYSNEEINPEIDESGTSETEGPSRKELKENLQELKRVDFTHLHNHSQFSILQSTTEVKALVAKAASYGMPAVAITDHGNMMCAFHFVKAVKEHNDGVKKRVEAAAAEGKTLNEQPLKAIVGCEFYVCRNMHDKTQKDNGYQIPMLAKNKRGYHNLAKMASQAYVEGFYYVPRIDRDLLLAHKEDIIATTGGLWGEIPSLILNVGEEQAEEAFLWWKEQFGDDFYAELNRHGLEEEDHVNEVLMRFCQKHNVRYFSANNNYYLSQDNSTAHEILLCIKDGNKLKDEIGQGRGKRFALPNNKFFFCSPDEMKERFKDLPEAIETTSEITDKIEPFELARSVLLPKFEIPVEFQDPEDEKDGGKRGENAYLRHLTFEGAAKRYSDLTKDITDRLEFELETIERTGYPGYFLIVQDFCQAAREMGVSVGPGRGSAAGSAVAYCIGITNVDPVEYDLLFERFLNPDRVSLPDIDIDFDDEGRGRVIDYVIGKYGASQVAQIITYGSMAAKSSIRDTARVMDLPLPDSDRIAKLMPDTSLAKLFGLSEKELKEKLQGEQFQNALELRKIYEEDSIEGSVLRQAAILEGSLRNTGIHACGVIITPSDIRELIPVATAKDSEMWCTQFDNSVVESAGLLKMDFLGLKTLTLIKDAVKIVEERHNVKLDPDEFPKDDEKTFELFQRGDTVGIFQYESDGMRKHMRDLKPTVFGDLIAMNALYRPGPMEYIPSFIKRKHGQEEITYDVDASREFLEETYGITVYQEQVMLLSQKLAGFTKGEADMLRKAMGKKIFALLEKMKPKFLDGCEKNGHDRKIAEKIWKDWEAFASYAFNKSHSTCYAWVAYQTAYLKANYPAAYMASVLSNNMSDIKQVTFFMEECRRMGIKVLGPDVNESNYKFTVNEQGQIRFGLGAIKGVGGGAVDAVIKEREEHGPYVSVYNLIERLDLRAANKKALENMVLAGALDGFETYHRAQYFAEIPGHGIFLEALCKYGNAIQQNKDAPPNLFGETEEIQVVQPIPPVIEKWGTLDALSREKEVVGLYISAHPLDDFKLEIENFCKGNLSDLKHLDKIKGRERSFAGIVTNVEHRISKKNKPFGTLEIEDYTDSHKFFLFSENYLKQKHFLVPGTLLYITGRAQGKKWKETEELEFKISKIQLLSELREKMTERITIDLKLEDLNEGLLEKLREAFHQKGHGEGAQVKVVFRVIDHGEKQKVQLPSRSMKIDLNNETIEHLDRITEVSYSLN